MKMSKENLMATTLDVFDYLMERDSDIGTNIKDTYFRSTCIQEDGVIYLLRDEDSKSDGVPSDFKITITEI